MALISLVVVAVISHIATTASAQLAPCPWLSPTTFQLPSVFSYWIQNVNADVGLQITDINGDSLVDLVYGWEDQSGSPYITHMCIYLNTQCGWVLQANYTGPDSSCATSSKKTPVLDVFDVR
jgi:hypothetical protein